MLTSPSLSSAIRVSMAKTSKTDVEVARLQASIMLWDRVFGLLARLIDKVPILAICIFGYLSIKEIAGKNTDFNAVGKVMMSLSANQWFAWLVASLCGLGYYRERTTRKETIKQHEAYIRELEERHEPKRRSSGLTSSGQGQPADRHAI